VDGVVADINFRTKRDGTRAGIGESIREGLVEVVTHLALKFYFFIDLKTG
jgi:hypothetical protein